MLFEIGIGGHGKRPRRHNEDAIWMHVDKRMPVQTTPYSVKQGNHLSLRKRRMLRYIYRRVLISDHDHSVFIAKRLHTRTAAVLMDTLNYLR